MKEQIITKEYLREHLNEVFVFGDNTARKGYGGAALLRDEPNTYGFITKKLPTNQYGAYSHNEYMLIFTIELHMLIKEIYLHPYNTYLISRLGAGLANQYGIYESIIRRGIRVLENFSNVRFLYED